MGLIRRLADFLHPPRETRADPSWEALASGGRDWTGEILSGAALQPAWGIDNRPRVTPRHAEGLSIVTACVNAITGAISSLPAYVFRRAAKGREEDAGHDVARLIREGPNARQTWPEFTEWLMGSMLLHGNGLAAIVSDPRSGRVIALDPLPWPNVTPLLLPSGRLAFDVALAAGLHGATGATRRYLDSEVLHLKDRSDDGLIGRSRLARASPPLRAALTQQAFNEYVYANRATPSYAVIMKQATGADNAHRLRAQVEQAWAGVRNAGKIMVIGGGDIDLKQLSVTPESLEMNAAARFSTEEVCRLFDVPPPIVGIWDHSTFTNSETAGRWFAQFCLAPKIRKIEEAFRRSVFSAADRETHEIEFDLSGFLRGDAEARWKAHEIAVRNNILDPNEIREVEGWNPRPNPAPAPPRDPAGGIA